MRQFPLDLDKSGCSVYYERDDEGKITEISNDEFNTHLAPLDKVIEDHQIWTVDSYFLNIIIPWEMLGMWKMISSCIFLIKYHC